MHILMEEANFTSLACVLGIKICKGHISCKTQFFIAFVFYLHIQSGSQPLKR